MVKRKQIEESKEAIRQKRKFVCLLTQTELFSHFMKNRRIIVSFEKKEEVDENSIEISRNFQAATAEIAENDKTDEAVDKSETHLEKKTELKQLKVLKCELKG